MFRGDTLDRIKAGDVSLAFRKWKRPGAQKGCLIKAPVGQLERLDVQEIDPGKITKQDTVKAGQSLEDLLDILDEKRGARRASLPFSGPQSRTP